MDSCGELLSEVRDIFRICPSCGRRFHVKLVSKNLVDEHKHTDEMKKAMMNPTPMGYLKGSAPVLPIIVEQDVPITIDIRDFQYIYQCKHCGHAWSEMREKESKA
jgi:DNA-directed RNA polymerase subunit M/transcription elongation factor TFIIS